MASSSIGRASDFESECREFESRLASLSKDTIHSHNSHCCERLTVLPDTIWRSRMERVAFAGVSVFVYTKGD